MWSSRRRRGATLVEAAVILGVLLILVLGMIDLSVGVYRSNLLAAAARQGARQASVHGEMATALGPWGPAAIGPICGDAADPLAQAVLPFLTGIDPATVTLQAAWLDGCNEVGARVRVTVTVPYRPVLADVFGVGTQLLQASSTLPIAH